MKQTMWIAGCVSLLLMCGIQAHSGQQTPIAAEGKTVIVASFENLNVGVEIYTRLLHIGKPSETRPGLTQSSCTYSRYPCSVVENLKVTVNHRPITVARSVFCDLADLNAAELNAEGKDAILTLVGGDASEGYVVKIRFNNSHVTNRSMSSLMAPEKALQETVYYLRILEDEDQGQRPLPANRTRGDRR